MNQERLRASWDAFRIANGLGLRAVESLPEDGLDKTPIPGMRTPKELVVHLFYNVSDFPAAVAKGSIADAAEDEARLVKELKTKDQLVAWCRKQWDTGKAIVPKIGDAELVRDVATPWGHALPGGVMMQILYDEYAHHRGQLYCFIRALGATPPSLYDYEGNAPEFRLPAERA